MRSMKLSNAALAAALLLPWVARAQDQGPAIQKKLESEYQLTKINDDRSDIVTAGSVLVLHKDKVMMIAATSSVNPCMNSYRDGKISVSGACGVGDRIRKIKFPSLGSITDKAPASHNFVSGEKFWLTKIDVRTTGKDHGVVLDFFSDAINDVRYRGVLTIPFGALMPTPDEALKLVAEVITVAPSDDDKSGDKKDAAPQGGQQQTSAPVQAPAPAVTEAAPPPLVPPPPPAPDPVEVSEGQSPDQVVAAMGPPLKKFKTGAKEVYTYKDVKITFVNGKVKDIQ